MPGPNNTFAATDPVPDPIREVIEIVEQDRAAQIAGERRGRPSLFTCPDCGGTLWQVDEPDLISFRCHVGHILSGEWLFQAQTTAVENALWTAARTLEDKALLGRQLARKARELGQYEAAARFEQQARAADEKCAEVRRLVERAEA